MLDVQNLDYPPIALSEEPLFYINLWELEHKALRLIDDLI